MIATLALPAPLRAQLEQETKSAFPRECCGLIEGKRDPLAPSPSKGGSKGDATALHPTPNLAPDSDRFEIDPAIHIALLRNLRGTGREILGCYHSHPGGRAEPSARDIAGAGETGFLWLIAALERQAAPVQLACFAWTGSAFAKVPMI